MGYRNNKVQEWLEFFLEGIRIVSKDAAEKAKNIMAQRDQDINTIAHFGKNTSSAQVLLNKIYESPIINSKIVAKNNGDKIENQHSQTDIKIYRCRHSGRNRHRKKKQIIRAQKVLSFIRDRLVAETEHNQLPIKNECKPIHRDNVGYATPHLLDCAVDIWGIAKAHP